MQTFLFDTTFILPFFRINIAIPNLQKAMKEVLPLIRGSAYISTCSLIEGKWKALREFQKSTDENYLNFANQALESFYGSSYFQLVNSWAHYEANKWADDLYKSGHRDYMDCMIAGTAKAGNHVLISQDGMLKKAIRQSEEWNSLEIINWKEFRILIDKELNK